jgi:hypothetical protein
MPTLRYTKYHNFEIDTAAGTLVFELQLSREGHTSHDEVTDDYDILSFKVLDEEGGQLLKLLNPKHEFLIHNGFWNEDILKSILDLFDTLEFDLREEG